MWNLDPGGMDPTKDLPLMANTADIRVRHYMLNLSVSFEKKILSGSITLFLESASEKETKEGVHTLKNEDGKNVTPTKRGRKNSTAKGVKRSRGQSADDDAASNSWNDNFALVLDSCDITVSKVEEIVLSPPVGGAAADQTKHSHGSSNNVDKGSRPCVCSQRLPDILGFRRNDFSGRNKRFSESSTRTGKPLKFAVQPWCVRVWKEGVTDADNFPSCIKIHYQTKPDGKSLTWAYDQAGRDCVFTQGAWINNRSLFPCQEPPGAMATWQSTIHTPSGWVALMSGDQEAQLTQQQSSAAYSYHTNMPVPASVLALAIGYWKCSNVPMADSKQKADIATCRRHIFPSSEPDRLPKVECDHEPWQCRINRTDQPVIPSRIFAPAAILPMAVSEFGEHIPRYMAALFEILGPHPGSRLDVVIMPKCFASIGLASPNIVFISQTLITGDGSLRPRLAHEISHSWFGILIGAKDWTEEWLSEGFATYMEDPTHAIAEGWTSQQYKEYSNLRSLIRYHALKAELLNSEAELQIMRPMGKGGGETDRTAGKPAYVKNGLNPDKWFLQVHYLKGYFLLQYLAKHLGASQLLNVIKAYVHKYHCKLVLSQEIFTLMFEMYPELKSKGITMESIYKDWLDCSGMPKALQEEEFTQGNSLVQQVNQEFQKWLSIDRYHKRPLKPSKKKQKVEVLVEPSLPTQKLLPDQVTLLMEYLLTLKNRINSKTLSQLKETYKLCTANAETRHRWCELVTRHYYMDGYGDIRLFLLEDQSMGVYLYGELMVHEDPVQQFLAEVCFQAVSKEMDRGCYNTVKQMIYGNKTNGYLL